MGLREVFVAQSVRADPPPVELPKEVVRRLVESGELGKGALPEGVDPQLLANLRQTYQERPAQPVLRVLAEPGWQRLVGSKIVPTPRVTMVTAASEAVQPSDEGYEQSVADLYACHRDDTS
ncbi:MAG: hypothetical protein ACRDRV_21350 [Pseudonocardiaceae bacterium]